jgi:DNA primase
VARALEAGAGEAVATCGTALTAGHGRLLHRFTEEVVVNFDQDEAGQKAALKSFETLVEEGLKVRVVELPAGHDPDSYLKAEGAEAYRARLGEAPLYMEWLIRKAARENELSTPPGKAAYLNMLLPALARLESAVERAAWLPVIAERGGLDERATSQELRRAMAGRTTAGAVAASAPPARVELVPAEKLLLARILRGAEGVDEALAELAESDLESLHGREALWAAKKVYLRGEPVDAARLEAEVESEETRRMLREIAVTDSPGADQGPRECVLELRHLALKRRLAEVQKGIPGASGESLDALLQQTNEIKRQITSL